jgi:hypothetical protein
VSVVTFSSLDAVVLSTHYAATSALPHVITVLSTTCYMILSAAESNKIGPDGKAGSGPKKDASGDKMSCSDRGMCIIITTHCLCLFYHVAC